MPPRRRKIADPPDLCPECFPNGWPDPTFESVGCMHTETGWSRVGEHEAEDETEAE